MVRARRRLPAAPVLTSGQFSGWMGLLLLVLVLLRAPHAAAQLPHLDAIPWFTTADSTSRLALVVDLDRFTDSKFDWNLNRILLTGVLPAGDDATFFLRLPLLTFDTGDVTLAGRWPWVLGEDGQNGWPNEKRVSGFGQIEVGVTGPAKLPLVKWVNYALALGLPTGSDRVYPFSSTSLPLRLELKKNVAVGSGAFLGLVAGYLWHMDSGRNYLDPTAFPSGYHLGASLDLFKGRGRRFSATYDFQSRKSRRSQLAGVQLWLPWTANGSVGFKVAAELQGTLDRPAAWYFTLAWRMDSPKYRLGAVPEEP